MTVNPAFVFGNGKSRLCIDPLQLRGIGTLYACNQAYSDIRPDILVSVDKDISREIQESGYSSKNVHYTRKSNLILDSGAKPILHNSGFSSGPVAVTLAAQAGHHSVYLIGMDLYGIGGEFNNVYAGMKHYKDIGTTPTYCGNWVIQMAKIFAEFGDQQFIQVSPLKVPDEWQIYPNYCDVTLSDFKSKILG